MKKILILLMLLCVVITASAEAPGGETAASWYDGLVLCLVGGLVIGGISVGVMAFNMKNVRNKSSASDYVEQGSLELRIQQDRYLYQTVTRRPKPKNNNRN